MRSAMDLGAALVVLSASCGAPSPSPVVSSPSPAAVLTDSTPTPAPNATSSALQGPADTPLPSPVAPPPPAPIPKPYRRVLSVGDSFNGAFSLALEKKFRADGASFVRDTWVAVAISTFAREPRFAALLDKHDPDLVVVNLGANHVDDGNPEAIVASVRAIVKRIGARDCYWIAPALWKKDTGIVDVLARSVAPCRFYDSKGFKVERRGDGWHPSVEGGALWADRFWEFFQRTRATVDATAAAALP